VKMILLSLCLLMPVADAQINLYNYGLIGKLQRDATVQLELGNWLIAADMYEDIIAIYKIEEGLYTTSGIDLMFQLRAWAEEAGDYEEAIKWSYMAHFAVIRSRDSDYELFNKLIHSNLYTPEDTRCLERSEEKIIRFKRTDSRCKEQRFYRADSIIRAVELQQHVIETLVASATELLFLYTLSEMAVGAVYGVDGDEIVLEWNTDGMPSMVENYNIRDRYRWRRYLKIQRDVLDDIREMMEQ